ncbi:MAG: DUF4012 domain-containing protein [Anaerolineales bacterium]|nr:DUF4012 domain-containing protein [Anaerolineales bacterium]
MSTRSMKHNQGSSWLGHWWAKQLFAPAIVLGVLLAGGRAFAAPLQTTPARPVADTMTIGAAAAKLGPHAPWLLGMDAPRTYLILVQNNHELRATGGFIAAIGTVSVDQGKITSFDFVDSYDLYSTTSTYPRRRHRCAATWASICSSCVTPIGPPISPHRRQWRKRFTPRTARDRLTGCLRSI